MKKTVFTILGFLLLSVFSAWLFVRANSQSAWLSLPTETQIANLKSTANGNKLTADMRNKMLEYLGKFIVALEQLKRNMDTLKIKKYCKWVAMNSSRRYVGGSGNAPCSDDLYDIYYLIEDWRFWAGIRNDQRIPYSSLILKSQKLWTHKFCALTTVAFVLNYDNDSEESKAYDEQICHIWCPVL